MPADAPRRRLARKLAAESEAYGYSLTTWGVGALAIRAFGVPSVLGVVGFVGGAVCGFAVLAAVAFDGLLGETDVSDRPLAVVSTVHVASTLGTLLAGQAVIRLAGSALPVPAALFCVGVTLTVAYNALLTGEAAVARIVL
ncbi:hypothetical protein [Halobaculum sp. D14]|uniref:hypothetical protein n=1 Tax=unclassified Halobaculum TaxID=2640896 RepID=UPI003EBB5635